MPTRRLSEATIERLPSYLRALREFDAGNITSEQLATMTGVNSAKVRKDLSHFGFHGTRGVGYDVRAMRLKIERELGVTERLGVLIVGAGNLGSALANFGGFAPQGFRIAALCDADPTKIGSRIGSVEVRPVDQLEAIVASERVGIGIIATPAHAAQEVADRFIAAGVTSLLNFAPVALHCPEGVLIVGAGNLGSALANFGGFAPQGFRIAALCDADPTKIGSRIGSVEVRPVEQLEAIVASERVGIGIIATPAHAAQEVADRFIAAGVTSLLNFAPVALHCPEGVHVRGVDLASELQILSFQMIQQHQPGLEAAAQ